jgi:lipase chaperone LimK
MIGRLRWIIMVLIFLGVALLVQLEPDRRQSVQPRAEATERPVASESEPAAWQRRLDAYQLELDATLRDPNLDPPARAIAIERLRARHFEAAEIPRVRELDRTRQHEKTPP